MRPEVVALGRLAAFALTGVALSRLACRGRGALSVAESALFALALAVLFRIAPWLCVAWAALCALAGHVDARDRNRSPQLLLPLCAAVALLWIARTPEPILWDEQIWLLKAKLPDLRAASLVHDSDAIPVGYPIGFPLLCAWLGGASAELGALLVRALCVVAFVGSVLRARPTALGRVALLCVATPLLLVHARAAYVDLPIGLLSAALYLELSAPTPVALRAIVLATLLATFKDEGIVHVLVLGVASQLQQPKAARRAVALALVAAGLAFVYWRVLLYTHDVIPSEHALGRPAWDRLAMLATQLFWHLADIRSFGMLFGAAIASALAAIQVGALRRDATTWLAILAALFWGVLAGPDRVREFAASGTLLGRLLIQIAPLAALLVAQAMLHFSAPADPEPIPLVAGAAQGD